MSKTFDDLITKEEKKQLADGTMTEEKKKEISARVISELQVITGELNRYLTLSSGGIPEMGLSPAATESFQRLKQMVESFEQMKKRS